MSEKLNRVHWLGRLARDCCAVCLVEKKKKSGAKKCDGVHFHKFCGARVIFTKKGLTCEKGHIALSVPEYFIVKTKEEALPAGDPRR
jgi:hypothetical protein